MCCSVLRTSNNGKKKGHQQRRRERGPCCMKKGEKPGLHYAHRWANGVANMSLLSDYI